MTTESPSNKTIESNVGQVLKAYIERVERLDEEIKVLNDDKRDVYAELKGNGFDVKALKDIIRMRKQDPNERAERDTILETYMRALGML